MFAHPAAVCMSYSEHMWFSLRICYLFGVGSIQSLVHAFLPDTCVTAASDTARCVTRLLSVSGCRADTNE